MSTKTTNITQSPWPGPQPYEVWQGAYFFGRKQDIEALQNMILQERLTILSADSGSGKTSLLRAGLIGKLIRERRNNPALIKPVLLSRNWGGGGGQGNAEQLFNYGLNDSIKLLQQLAENKKMAGDLRNQARKDFEGLSKISLGKSFFENVANLCNFGGGLILIFDQFEEIFRAKEGMTSEALDLIIDLYRFEPRARVVIALRSEFHKDLRDLEAYVGGLYHRSYFLKPMITPSVLDAVKRSAAVADIDVSESVIKGIVNKLNPVSPKKSVNLLTLQAVLYGLFEYSREKNLGKKVVIDDAIFRAYVRERSSSDLAKEALIIWIDNALKKALPKTSHITEEFSRMPPEVLNGLVYRIASRMAPYLSSGNYKTAAFETDLLHNTLRDDLIRLHPRFGDTEASDWNIVNYEPVKLGIQLDHKESSQSKPNSNLSGVARSNGWSPAMTGEYLASVFMETLYRLQNENILKRIYIDENQVWELVHDGIGRPFVAWSTGKKNTWEDCCYALTASKGIDIDIIVSAEQTQVQKTADNICWQGCFVSPQGDTNILTNYKFVNCDLKGTIFAGCVFQGGEFNNCVMDGSLFINCHFEAGPDGHPFIFDKCIANAMTFLTPEDQEGPGYSEMQSVSFIECKFSQVKFAGVEISGQVILGKDTTLLLCHFVRLARGRNTNETPKIIIDGGKLDRCAWDNQSISLFTLKNMADVTNCGEEIRLSNLVSPKHL